MSRFRWPWLPQPRFGEQPSFHPSDKKCLTIGLVRNCQLTEDVWQIIQQEFGGPGGHTFDLMVLDSNVMKDRVTVCLALPQVHP